MLVRTWRKEKKRSEKKKRKDAGELILSMRINNKTDLKYIGYGEVVLNSCGCGEGPARGCCEQWDKYRGSVKNCEVTWGLWASPEGICSVSLVFLSDHRSKHGLLMYWCEEWFATSEFNCSWEEFPCTTSDITQPNSECRSLCFVLTVYRLKFTMFVFGSLTIQLPFVMPDFKAAGYV
jgi:hypothetical protein